MRTKVLLVDDEIEFVSALAERLWLREFDVMSVSQPEDALRIIRDDPPEIVLLDYKMPGMNGIEALKEIKHINPYIQVIVLTGYGEENNIQEAINSGASDYIMKPADISILTEKINHVIKMCNGSTQIH